MTIFTQVFARPLALVFALLLGVSVAQAGTDCVTRKSGSVSVTTCGSGKSFSQCRSYRSGSVIKTSCR
ncbi:hypothetical protein [Bradyrhizobium neotropicale]|uniref:hypothetical protein n=1 Tax=Bradyrhizobium neotropicale TaxID=1497615 RepID=UPI001AD72961|nr:hypothetical protein [Bradyrhizobium neotropicale]MBO4228369.1 hypothetical protein [Bradyrhizobium neotropicale]